MACEEYFKVVVSVDKNNLTWNEQLQFPRVSEEDRRIYYWIRLSNHFRKREYVGTCERATNYKRKPYLKFKRPTLCGVMPHV